MRMLRQSMINKLEQEKGKLETYARRTLSAFKDKYMAALQTMKVRLTWRPQCLDCCGDMSDVDVAVCLSSFSGREESPGGEAGPGHVEERAQPRDVATRGAPAALGDV